MQGWTDRRWQPGVLCGQDKEDGAPRRACATPLGAGQRLGSGKVTSAQAVASSGCTLSHAGPTQPGFVH